MVLSGSIGTTTGAPCDALDEDGEAGCDEARLEAADEDLEDARLIDASDGALVEEAESTPPHHSGRRPLSLFGFEEFRSATGASNVLLDRLNEGSEQDMSGDFQKLELNLSSL
jgi:hypothetical protein